MKRIYMFVSVVAFLAASWAAGAQEIRISIDYADDVNLSAYATYLEYDEFEGDDYDYGYQMVIKTNTAVKGFRYIRLGNSSQLGFSHDFGDENIVIEDSVLYSLDVFLPEEPLVITRPSDPGIYSSRGISYIDENNARIYFIIYDSHADGSLNLSEFFNGRPPIERGIEREFQTKINTDPAYRDYEMRLEWIMLEQTGSLNFDGTVTVWIDELSEPKMYEVPIEVIGEKSRVVWTWVVKPGGFDFLKDVVKPNVEPEPISIEMVFVKGGTFTMGNDSDNFLLSAEKPVHSVTVSDFSIGKYPVTQAQWTAVMGYNYSNFKGDNLPVENVSWDDVQRFISRLNSATGKTYRLPTEAEWEYAARGGTESKGYRFAGSDNINEVAWHRNNSNRKTHPVGGKKPNELEIYDMSGNIGEWVSDWFGYYTAEAKTNPEGPPAGDVRIRRGGSWSSAYVEYNSVTSRLTDSPEMRSEQIGFRLAISE